jgi:hypothetical protein
LTEREGNGMDTLIVYPEGTGEPGVSFPTANGFVARVVSAVAEDNIPDAERVCKILNAHFAQPPQRSSQAIRR